MFRRMYDGILFEMPQARYVKSLYFGDVVHDCFGRQQTVTEITASGNYGGDPSRPFVNFKMTFGVGAGTTITGEMVAGNLIRTVPMSSRWTSVELDRIEREMRREMEAVEMQDAQR